MCSILHSTQWRWCQRTESLQGIIALFRSFFFSEGEQKDFVMCIDFWIVTQVYVSHIIRRHCVLLPSEAFLSQSRERERVIIIQFFLQQQRTRDILKETRFFDPSLARSLLFEKMKPNPLVGHSLPSKIFFFLFYQHKYIIGFELLQSSQVTSQPAENCKLFFLLLEEYRNSSSLKE